MVKIGLVQINMSGRRPTNPDGPEPPAFGLLPYSMGLLKSYAITHAAEQHEWSLPIYRRVGPAEGAQSLIDCDVAAFSVYIWNVRLSLAIADELKRRRPEVLVVFGGPQVPDRPAAAEAFLREHPYIDVVCHGEGEVVFTKLLDRAAGRGFDDVPGVSYIDRTGAFITHPKAPRLADLEEIPSPYAGGMFDDLFAARPDDRWVMIWETNRGCPFSCSFCDWGSAINGKVFRFSMERLEAEIAWMSQQKIQFVWTADANFGALKRDLELAERVVDSFKRTGFPASITVQSSKNATERVYEIQRLLQKEMHAYGVTLAMQSVNDTTLANIKRANISSESYRELQRRFAADGVYTYTDLILGLPGDSYRDFAAGVSHVIEGGQHNHIQLFSCSVLPNAEMGDPEYQARYGMKLLPQAIRSVHEQIDLAEWEVDEYIDIVVETDAMPGEEWLRAKVFAWLVDFAYYDRVLQIPLLVLSRRHDWPVHELIEVLVEADPETHPITASLVAALREKARSIQQGGPEYFPIPEAGGLLWPGDQRTLITLVMEDSIDSFYREVGELLGAFLERRGGDVVEAIVLDEALTINRAALTLPFESGNKLLVTSHNVWEYYQSLLVDDPIELEEGLFAYGVDCRRQNWETLERWALLHLAIIQGEDKRRYLRKVVSSRQARRPVAEPVPVA